MRPELPGFYYDEEKNRYFPIKGPIPGSKSSSSSSRTKRNTDPKPIQEANYQKSSKLKALKLVYSRELNGNVVCVNKKKCNFNDEIQKMHASSPVVWKYGATENIGDAALKQLQVDIQTPVGLSRENILVAGSTGGCVSVLRASKAGQALFDESETQGGIECTPVSVLPRKENDIEEREAAALIWRLARSSQATSSISSIQLVGTYDASEDFHRVNRALITTLGSNGCASIFFLNIAEELNTITPRSLRGVSTECTIWTADCSRSGSHAALGTDLGAALVDLETGAGSYFLRSKSDVFALQFHQSGKIVHCGLRNGAIVSVDLRERPGRPFPRLTRHHIRYQSSSKKGQTSKNKQWFELKGNLNPSQIIYMPSSLTCLKTLKTYDQYLMASSMDGTIKLYDQRMVKREGVAVQTYDGHANSHSRIKFGIDPSERFLMSGGEDCYTRIWSIKSGQLLSENKFSESIPSVVCWSAVERQRNWKDSIVHGAWLGSREAIYNVV